MRFSLKALALTAGFVSPLVWLIYSTLIATTMSRDNDGRLAGD